MLRAIIFRIGTIFFGAEINKVKGVTDTLEILKSSNAHFPYMTGTINLYGDIVPVLDLHKKLQINSDAIHSKKYIVTLISGDKSVAFPVDEIESYRDLPEECIHPVPTILQGAEMQYIWKIASLEEILFLLLDPDRLFEDVETYSLHRPNEVPDKIR